MVKKELEIKTFPGETPFSKVYVLSQNIKGFSTYERAKAIDSFIEKETRVLETHISNEIREFLHKQGISIDDGSNRALQQAFCELKAKGRKIDIVDRYYEIGNERIIGENNNMTVILEDDILSCAIELIIETTEN